MYKKRDYFVRGVRFLNNIIRPGHKKLSTLMFYGTDICDSACKHCLIWAKRPIQHLPKEKFYEVMQSKCITKETNVGLEGGEFLLHPDAMEILQWFHLNHPNFDLLSNCLKPENVINAVKLYPPRRLFISLDGTKETYMYMRGKDGYNSVLQVINSCKELVPISLMFTLSPFNNFDDLEHVIELAQTNKIDIRVGVYNDIAFFDTLQDAHNTDVGELRKDMRSPFESIGALLKANKNNDRTPNVQADNAFLEALPSKSSGGDRFLSFKDRIPSSLRSTNENYDFLLLYDEWRNRRLRIKCHSILDSLVIHPNGDVPICQNLNKMLGNVHEQSLDEIFNSAETQSKQRMHVSHCNQCWINFHRKFDIVLLRTLEKFLPKRLVNFIYGPYQWTSNSKITYKKIMSGLRP